MERASSILKSYPAHSKGGRSTNALLGKTNSDIQEKHRRVTGYLRSLFEIRRWEKVCILLTGRSRWLGEWWRETKCRYFQPLLGQKIYFPFFYKKSFFPIEQRLFGWGSFLLVCCANIQVFTLSCGLSLNIFYIFTPYLSAINSGFFHAKNDMFLERLRLSCPLPRRTPSERDDMKTMWRLYDNIVEPSQAKNYISMNSIWGKSPSWE